MRLVRGHARREGWAVGYMSQDMAQVTDWHGKVLGQAHVKSSWQYPRALHGSHAGRPDALAWQAGSGAARIT
jgi:hypothetical protein